jgi:hypothetical protein
VTDSKEIIWTKDMIDDCKVKNDWTRTQWNTKHFFVWYHGKYLRP